MSLAPAHCHFYHAGLLRSRLSLTSASPQCFCCVPNPVQGQSLLLCKDIASMKEATARIKINKLLEAAGWRFFPRQQARQHSPRTERRHHGETSMRSERFREDQQGLHRFPAARCPRLSAHRP